MKKEVPKKERAEKYDPKLAINGSFEDVIKLSVSGAKSLPRLYADFNNTDPQGRVRFTNGTFTDIERLKIELQPGMKVILDSSDGLVIEGVVEFSEEENLWVGRYDHDKLRDISGNI